MTRMLMMVAVLGLAAATAWSQDGPPVLTTEDGRQVRLQGKVPGLTPKRRVPAAAPQPVDLTPMVGDAETAARLTDPERRPELSDEELEELRERRRAMWANRLGSPLTPAHEARLEEIRARQRREMDVAREVGDGKEGWMLLAGALGAFVAGVVIMWRLHRMFG